MHVLEGFGLGLATAILLGPVFFTLLKASLEYGFSGGAWAAAGIMVSDVLVLLICSSGARLTPERAIGDQNLAFAAGILLMVLGLVYLLKRSRTAPVPTAIRKRDALGLLTKGFLVNFLNPFVFAVWAGLVLYANQTYSTANDRTGFFTALLFGVLASDLLKAWSAPRLAPLLSAKVMTWVHRGIAFLLLLSSARSFWIAAEHAV
jgi:threonine/homoserine/homoserine lactone efflux protein